MPNAQNQNKNQNQNQTQIYSPSTKYKKFNVVQYEQKAQYILLHYNITLLTDSKNRCSDSNYSVNNKKGTILTVAER